MSLSMYLFISYFLLTDFSSVMRLFKAKKIKAILVFSYSLLFLNALNTALIPSKSKFSNSFSLRDISPIDLAFISALGFSSDSMIRRLSSEGFND